MKQQGFDYRYQRGAEPAVVGSLRTLPVRPLRL